MDKDQKRHPHSPLLKRKMGANIIILLVIIGLTGGGLGLNPGELAEADFEPVPEENLILDGAIILQGNSILPFSGQALGQDGLCVAETSPKVNRTIKVVVTGYSSSPLETDDTPNITASGTLTRDGVVATNLLPIGTEVRFPELFGEKVFVVEDRMSSRAGYQADIWFPSALEALVFGAKRTYMEVI